jgi:hypothetical protein
VVKGRRSSSRPGEPEAAALGTPAPVTEDEVEALRHGKLDARRIQSILESHRQPDMGELGRRPKKMTPIDLDERALRHLSEGATPSAIESALEKAMKKDRDRTAAIDERQDRPSKKPPS